MAEKWAAMSKGARILLASVLFYAVESVVILATDADANNGYASVLIGAVTSTFGAFLATAAWNTDYLRAVTSTFGAFLATAAWNTDYLRALLLRWRLRAGAEQATATVAALVAFHNSDFTYPVFEYATPDGATHRHADASSQALEVGATTEVRYLPDRVDLAVGPMSRFNALVFAILAALGVVLLVMMPLMTVQAVFS